MLDLLLPATDAGVAVQFAIFVVVMTIALRRSWPRYEWRIFTIGVLLMGVGFFGLRAVH